MLSQVLSFLLLLRCNRQMVQICASQVFELSNVLCHIYNLYKLLICLLLDMCI